jgi:hypothetical protein
MFLRNESHEDPCLRRANNNKTLLNLKFYLIFASKLTIIINNIYFLYTIEGDRIVIGVKTPIQLDP